MFNRPIQGLLPQINREPINVDNNNAQYEALDPCQSKCSKNNDTQNAPSVFSTGSTVVGKWEDGGLWVHSIIVEPNGSDHRGSSYTIQITKMGRIITHDVKDICAMPISAEQYFPEQLRKTTGQSEDMKVIPTEADRQPKQ